MGVCEVLKSTVRLPPARDNPPTCACGGPESRGGGSCLGAVWGPEGKGLVVIKGEKEGQALRPCSSLSPPSIGSPGTQPHSRVLSCLCPAS